MCGHWNGVLYKELTGDQQSHCNTVSNMPNIVNYSSPYKRFKAGRNFPKKLRKNIFLPVFQLSPESLRSLYVLDPSKTFLNQVDLRRQQKWLKTSQSAATSKRSFQNEAIMSIPPQSGDCAKSKGGHFKSQSTASLSATWTRLKDWNLCTGFWTLRKHLITLFSATNVRFSSNTSAPLVIGRLASHPRKNQNQSIQSNSTSGLGSVGMELPRSATSRV